MKTNAKNLLTRCGLMFGQRNLYRGARFFARAARGDMDNDLASNGESMVQMKALRLASLPACVFDVGANIGEWTVSLLNVSEQLRIEVNVHCFEPCRKTFELISESLGGNTGVTLNNEACSSHEGTALMHVYGDGLGTNSLVDPINHQTARMEEVSMTTIDAYCALKGIGKINLLKVDAEGHDYEVIAGAVGMLDKKAIGILQFEYNQRWIGCRRYLKDVFTLLAPRGYEIGKVTGTKIEFYKEWHWEMETYVEGNYIACSDADMAHFSHRKMTWLGDAL
jgi:FkbM family methyltransferase